MNQKSSCHQLALSPSRPLVISLLRSVTGSPLLRFSGSSLVMKTVLTIAGSDTSGGAGIQADLRTFNTFNVHGLSAITALTAQNPGGIKGVFPVPAPFVLCQIETLMEAYTIDAVKVGMLATEEIALALVEFFKSLNPPIPPFSKGGLGGIKSVPIVLDPVMVSTTGYPLLEKDGLMGLKRLLPFVTILTPNLEEATRLVGFEVRSIGDMKEAARRIKDLGPEAVLVKGGHLEDKATDILYNGKGFTTFDAPRVKGKLRGSGCILSAAIAASLARGMKIEEAVRKAKAYVTRLIRRLSVTS